jgi:hypothetical protein
MKLWLRVERAGVRSSVRCLTHYSTADDAKFNRHRFQGMGVLLKHVRESQESSAGFRFNRACR